MKRTKPLIERYLTYLRVTKEKIIASLKETTFMTPQTHAWKMAEACSYTDIHTQMAEQAIKYRLAPSATAMINALCPHPPLREEMTFSTLVAGAESRRALAWQIPMPIWHLPEAPVWIELEEPIEINMREIAGLFFCSPDRQVEQQLKKPQPSTVHSVLQAARCQGPEEAQWQLYFFDKNGTPTSSYQYLEQAKVWVIPELQPCPTGECGRRQQGSQVIGMTETSMTPCTSCITHLSYWGSWFVTALLALQGEYAVSIEGEWPRYREQTTRKVRRTNSYKYDEIPIQHEYYIISFDANVKKHSPSQVSQQRRGETEQHGSWVAATRQINPESVVYVKHDFGQTIRHLDPERNPRWKQKQTIIVKSYSKSIPIKVANLKRRMTRVIASAYEESRGLCSPHGVDP